MSTWVIGDVQGCFRTLRRLLKKCQFDFGNDRLWFVGDLVNRGPRSLETLNWIYEHRRSCTVVLGNHDLHLLMRAGGVRKKKSRDTLEEILGAANRRTLLKWLRKRPLIHIEGNNVLVHAGLSPHWTIDEAFARAKRVEALLDSDEHSRFLAAISTPSEPEWSEELETVAVMTRIRMVDDTGKPLFGYSGPPDLAPSGYRPWFEVPHGRSNESRVLFGHWAALGHREFRDVVALDTGCVYKNQLTAYCLEDACIFQQEYCD